MKFLFYTENGETLDLAMHLAKEHEVLFCVQNKEYKKIGEGIVTHVSEWHRYLDKGYTWVFDSCSFGDLQDWLRSEGEAVFGGSAKGDKLENDRQMGQDWFHEAGFYQPFSKNFKSLADTIHFVEKNREKQWILKQNGDAPKSINYKGRFDNSVDLLFHLHELERQWNEHEYGIFDVDLMEIVEGMEVGATAFFNGSKFLENKDGKVTGFLDFEEKKEADGGLGETCGEMGTTFIGVTEDTKLFKDILLRPSIIKRLADIGFHGVFNINCIVDKNGKITALEPTMRMGVPSTSYELIEGLDTDTATLIKAVANELDEPIYIKERIGMVLCLVAKPFPLEVDVEEQGTSQGEKLWILDRNEQPIGHFTEQQLEHIHLYNFYKDETSYKVATKSGYLLTVTRTGTNIKAVRNQLIEYVKSNLFLSGMKYRTDVGKRAEEFVLNELQLTAVAR